MKMKLMINDFYDVMIRRYVFDVLDVIRIVIIMFILFDYVNGLPAIGLIIYFIITTLAVKLVITLFFTLVVSIS